MNLSIAGSHFEVTASHLGATEAHYLQNPFEQLS